MSAPSGPAAWPGPTFPPPAQTDPIQSERHPSWVSFAAFFLPGAEHLYFSLKNKKDILRMSFLFRS